MKVVLVHGIWDGPRIFRHMTKALAEHEHDCFAPSLKPSDARLGIEDLAIKLKAYIDQTLESDETFVLVGFSMGCLISRFYLQLLDGRKRCEEFHAISGPLKGSFWAHFYPGQGARDMQPNSNLLNRLNASEGSLESMKLFSYRTPYDLMILPAKSSEWDIAENIKTKCPLHALMVKDPIVVAKLIERLNKLDPDAKSKSNTDTSPQIV